MAIVDAYDDPNIESDLAVYSSTYGLPSCTTANGCFKKVNQTGGTNYPVKNAGWSLEIARKMGCARRQTRRQIVFRRLVYLAISRVENLIQGHMLRARPRFIVRDHDHTVLRAPDVDLQEVGARVEQAWVALVRAYYQHT